METKTDFLNFPRRTVFLRPPELPLNFALPPILRTQRESEIESGLKEFAYELGVGISIREKTNPQWCEDRKTLPALFCDSSSSRKVIRPYTWEEFEQIYNQIPERLIAYITIARDVKEEKHLFVSHTDESNLPTIELDDARLTFAQQKKDWDYYGPQDSGFRRAGYPAAALEMRIEAQNLDSAKRIYHIWGA